ncbi:MAG: S-layer homology domain-containing protein [Lachnospirales bacterium]
MKRKLTLLLATIVALNSTVIVSAAAVAPGSEDSESVVINLLKSDVTTTSGGAIDGGDNTSGGAIDGGDNTSGGAIDSDDDDDDDDNSSNNGSSSNKTEDDDEDDDVVQTVFDVVGKVDENGKYVVSIEDKGKDYGFNNSANDIVINVKDVPADASVVSVNLPTDVVKELNNASATSSVKINVENFGSVTLGKGVVSQLAKSSVDEVNVTLSKTEDSFVIAISDENGLITGIKDGVKVAIPVLSAGDVLVVVDEFGNETIVKKSLIENGTAYALLNGSCELKVINNAKEFGDVSDGSWYNSSVDFVSSHELFEGVSQGVFAPNENMSRAMLATVLMRLDDGNSGTSSFDDVPSNAWYANSVGWAANAGVINGTGDGNFRPNDDITREQLAVMMYNYTNYAGLDTSGYGSSSFSDSSDISFWATDAMDWAVSNGILQGNNNNLNPKDNATRAEVAAVVERFISFMVK